MLAHCRRITRLAWLAAVLACGPAVAGECNEENRCTRIIGIGLAAVQDEAETSWAERRVAAVRAAKLDALRSIAEQVHGVRYQSRSQVGGSRLGSDRFSVTAEGVISGVKFVRVEPLDSGIFQATAELELRQ